MTRIRLQRLLLIGITGLLLPLCTLSFVLPSSQTKIVQLQNIWSPARSAQHQHQRQFNFNERSYTTPRYYGNERLSATSKFTTGNEQDDGEDESHLTPKERSNKSNNNWTGILQASLLIAGTTVGGGFLALPATVVIPLGGFPPAAVSLLGVWFFLGWQSWILSQSLVQCHKVTKQDGLGIVYLTQHVFQGVKSSKLITRLVSCLLVLLTEATLVSQLSRAGILFADMFPGAQPFFSSSSLVTYRIGCASAAIFGAILTFGDVMASADEGSKRNAKEKYDDALILADAPTTTTTITTTTNVPKQPINQLATYSNTILTTVFLASAVLLFQAGKSSANWSRCLAIATNASWTSTLLKATPIMLQLLVYGEILPNVCRMLDYRLGHIRVALFLGSTIPLVLLTGWAALGVALLPSVLQTAATKVVQDPVSILLHSANPLIKSRLLWLAVSAIGTTILGSYLALQTAYRDFLVGLSTVTNKNDTSKSSSVWWSAAARKRLLQRPLIETVSIVAPPLAIAIISPSLFLQAIEFAGAYPVLLLYGVIPPLLFLRMKKSSAAVASSSSRSRNTLVLVKCLGLLSMAMVATNAAADLQRVFVWLYGLLSKV